ncbi:MAG TPA: hypothetical protein VFW87_25195 [Pirellulales bacterium]|nr:hypothetical protein [Pirellulales bacterium]
MSRSQLAATACLVVSAAFLAGGMGDIQPPAATWCGLTLIAAYGWRLLLARSGWTAVRARILASAICVGALAALVPGSGSAVLTMTGVLGAMRLAVTLPDDESRLLDKHLVWSYLFAIASLAYRQEPYCRGFIDELCHAGGQALAGVLKQPWAPSSTALGWELIVAYLLLVAVVVWPADRASRLTTATLAAGLLAASLSAYVVTASLLATAYRGSAHFASLPDHGDASHAGQHNAAPFTWATPLAAMYPMSYQVILLWLLLTCFVVLTRLIPAPTNDAATRQPTRQPTRRARPADNAARGRLAWMGRLRGLALLTIAVAGSACAMLIWSPTGQYARPDRLRILVHKHNIDWEAPRHGSYGDRSGGMFGLLADHLRCHRHAVTAEPISDATDFKNVDVIILINLQEYFSEAMKAKILDFVREGGGLLIAGDHTGVSGLREPANHLVRDLGIELNFDSAKAFSNGWTGGFEYLAHPITRGQPWWYNEANIWVGASLTVRPPAYSLVLGRYAFSDPGDMTNPRGYLGDMRYSPGERLGDLPLVAAREFGRGRVVVWGDTSPLQNMAWTFSHDYMERTLTWLGEREGNLPAWVRVPQGLLFFSCAAALILLCPPPKRAAVAAAVAIGLLVLVRLADAQKPQDPGGGPRAYIDLAHLPDTNLNTWLRDGFAGLAQMTARSGLLPYALNDWAAQPWEHAKLVVLVAPIRPLSRREEERLLAFVRSGGHVLVCLGWEESAGWRPFLQRLGLHILNAPLGQLDGTSAEGESVHLQNAWPLVARRGVAVPLEWRPLISAQGQQCAMLGASAAGGSFTMVADSRFLRNINLEGRFEVQEANIRFFRSFMESYVTRSSQSGPGSGSVAAAAGPE